jgi:hypothetical protein
MNARERLLSALNRQIFDADPGLIEAFADEAHRCKYL